MRVLQLPASTHAPHGRAFHPRSGIPRIPPELSQRRRSPILGTVDFFTMLTTMSCWITPTTRLCSSSGFRSARARSCTGRRFRCSSRQARSHGPSDSRPETCARPHADRQSPAASSRRTRSSSGTGNSSPRNGRTRGVSLDGQAFVWRSDASWYGWPARILAGATHASKAPGHAWSL